MGEGGISMKIMHKSAALAAALILTAGISVQAADLTVMVDPSTSTGTATGNAVAQSLYGQTVIANKLVAMTGVNTNDLTVTGTTTTADVISKDLTVQNQLTVQNTLNANKAVVVELGAANVNASTVNGNSLSIAGGKFHVDENGDVYAQNGTSQFQVRDDYLGMNYGTNTSIGLNEDGVSINSGSYQIDGATGDIATDGTLSVGQGANINGGLAVSGGANINGGLTVDGMDVGGSIAQNTADIQKNTAAINQETADRTAADQILQQGIQNNSNAISSLNSRVSDLGGEIDNVGAISAALAGLHPLDYDGTGSKFQLAAAMGNYDGSQAAAIGGFYHFNEDVMMSVGGATAFDGDKKAAFNVGVSFRVGRSSSAKRLNSDDVIAQLAAMNDKIAALEAENQKLTEKVAALQDSEAAPKA